MHLGESDVPLIISQTQKQTQYVQQDININFDSSSLDQEGIIEAVLNVNIDFDCARSLAAALKKRQNKSLTESLVFIECVLYQWKHY